MNRRRLPSKKKKKKKNKSQRHKNAEKRASKSEAKLQESGKQTEIKSNLCFQH